MAIQDLKEFKNHLLSSGIPLEAEVSELLSANGWIVIEEQPFYILNNFTNETERSTIEIIGRKTIPLLGKKSYLHFDVDIECKYRNPSTKWVFFTSQQVKSYASSSLYLPSGIFNFPSRNNMEHEGEIYSEVCDVLSKLFVHYPLVSRSVQIAEKWSRGEISNSCEQLMKSVKNWNQTNVPQLLKFSVARGISMILPIITTNAEMIFFEKCNIEAIRDLKEEGAHEGYRAVDKVAYLYKFPSNLNIKEKYSEEATNQLFIPIINVKSLIGEVERIEQELNKVLLKKYP